MIKLQDKIWFESHQPLLLRIANTSHGRDLLNIKEDFPLIHHIGTNFTSGVADINSKDEYVFLSQFKSGTPMGNLIRSRWFEFSRYAKTLYSHGSHEEIYHNGQWKFAATTSTFQPEADPASVAGDTQINRDNQSTWSNARNGTTGTLVKDATTSIYFLAEYISAPNLYRVGRVFIPVDTSSLPDTDIITSAEYQIVPFDRGDAYSDSCHIVETSQASTASHVLADFDNLTFASLGSKSLSSMTLNVYNSVVLTDLSKVSKTGVTKLGFIMGYDLNNTTPSTINNRNYLGIRSADNLSNEPILEVIHTSSVGSLVNGGLINKGLIGGRLCT